MQRELNKQKFKKVIIPLVIIAVVAGIWLLKNNNQAVEIAKYGVMQTPALVINSKVVSYGKLIKVEEAKKLIEKSEVTK